MSDKAKRFELEKGLYAVDTRSGHGDSPSGISGVADRIHKEIEESFNPDAVRRVDVDKMTKMGEGPAEIRGPITFPDYTCYIYRQNLYIRQNGRDELYVYGVATRSWTSTKRLSVYVTPSCGVMRPVVSTASAKQWMGSTSWSKQVDRRGYRCTPHSVPSHLVIRLRRSITYSKPPSAITAASSEPLKT
jgi:hypothetical protein